MSEIVYLANDNLLELKGLKNQATAGLITGATVSVKVIDVDGSTFATVTLTDVSGAAGDYRGTLASTEALVADRRYIAEVTVAAGADGNAQWREPLIARERVI